MVNPKVGESFGLKIPDWFDQVESANEILKVRMEVLNNVYPREFLEKYWPYNFDMPTYLPKAFEIEGLSFDDPIGLSAIVHMDDPLDFPLAMKKTISNPSYGGTYNIRKHTSDYIQFLETVVDVNETITDYQKVYGHKVFKAKSNFGLGRPEEVLPELGALLTAYKEGCPNHGAAPQGHLTLSQAAILALYRSYDVDEVKIKDMLYASYLWGQFRCLAGVHYGIDGIMSILLVGGFDSYLREDIIKDYNE